MKKIFTLFIACFLAFSTQAQLPDGSVCPDFTGTDIDGNVWNLYDLLDEGYTVIIDVSATWCGPCWSYHLTKALDDVYENYGPDGTQEIMVLWIEGDASTNLDCIYDLPGCNNSTTGDWTDGTHFPIIDDSSIADLLQITYFPTIFQVCQNRIISVIGQATPEEIYESAGVCPVPFGANNAGILQYIGESGNFCGVLNFQPTVMLQNLGTSDMTSATVELWVNSALVETLNWTGNLASWNLENIVFGNITVSESSDIQIIATEINGVADEDETNNTIETNLNKAVSISDNYITLELMTDDYPQETSWELSNSDGKVISSGSGYIVGATLYSIPLVLPSDDCYEFVIFDTFGDGVSDGDGHYNIVDSDGNVVVEGVSNFGFEKSNPIFLEGGIDVVDAGAIVSYSGESGAICSDFTYSPIISIQNRGSNEVTSAVVEVRNGTVVIAVKNWTGNLSPASTTEITLDAITLTESASLSFSLTEINGVLVPSSETSVVMAEFTQEFGETEKSAWTMELQLGSYGFEIYWQISNSDGDVVAFGGNETVGAEGGGTVAASSTDPGAYAANALITEQIQMPEIMDCYNLLVVDSYGDGLSDGGGGYLKISDEDGNEILYNDYGVGVIFTEHNSYVLLNSTVSTNEFGIGDNIIVYPNPVSNVLNTRLELTSNSELVFEIYNVHGKTIITKDKAKYASGVNEISTDVSNFPDGVYYMKVMNGSQELTEKFVVLK